MMLVFVADNQAAGQILIDQDTQRTLEGEPLRQPGAQPGQLPGQQLPDGSGNTVESAEDEEVLPFGSNLFTGRFSAERDASLNPDYVVATGDRVVVQTWGAVMINDVFVVDGQGNIFLPEVGPVLLAGRRNADLTKAVKAALGRVYRDSFGVYTNLLSAQPIGVYVTGFVNNPGRYGGLPTDSVLYFLDRAQGIDTELGSYRAVTLLRGPETLARIDLYDFLLSGSLPIIQLKDGDTVLVGPRGPVIEMAGQVARPMLVEMRGPNFAGKDVLDVVPESALATEVTLTGLRNGQPVNETYDLAGFRAVLLRSGDRVELRDDGNANKILIRFEGEFSGPSVLAVRRGAKLVDLLNYVPVDPALADVASIHLLRESVRNAQKQSIEDSLFRLERNTLLALSSSAGEVGIRKAEAGLVSQFVARAREIDPLGRVVVSIDDELQNILLEDGDVVVIPQKTNVVQVGGEITVAQALVHRPDATASDYVDLSGGYTNRSDKNNFIIIHASGAVERDPDAEIRPGDQIIVMPVIDAKELQNAIDIATIIARVVVAAGIFIGI